MTKNYTLDTGITLDYRQDRWLLERIALDATSNHLPEDSGGTTIHVKLKQEGNYVDLRKVDPTKEIEEVVLEDDGKGYDPRLLAVLFSTKTLDGLSVGQFGEGSKMVAAAALRNDVDLVYQSRNWTARPAVKEEDIDGHKIRRLSFKITENGNNIQGSRTVIRKPSRQFVQEVIALPEKVLHLKQKVEREEDNIDKWTYRELYVAHNVHFSFTDSRILSSEYPNRILETKREGDSNNKYIFVKGVKICSETALFSYDLGLKDIPPDRHLVNHLTVNQVVGEMLKECTDTSIIERILMAAKEKPDTYCFEYYALQSTQDDTTRSHSPIRERNPLFFSLNELPPCIINKDEQDFISRMNITYKDVSLFLKEEGRNQEYWKQTFEKLYGPNALIASHQESLNEDAKIQNFNPVKLNFLVSKYLVSLGIKKVDNIIGNDTETRYSWVDRSELKLEEIAMLDRVPLLTHYMLGKDQPVDVRVYESKYIGNKPIPIVLGITFVGGSQHEGYIGIKRSQLESRELFDNTYIHELGHYVTRIADHNGRTLLDLFVGRLVKDTTKLEPPK